MQFSFFSPVADKDVQRNVPFLAFSFSIFAESWNIADLQAYYCSNDV